MLCGALGLALMLGLSACANPFDPAPLSPPYPSPAYYPPPPAYNADLGALWSNPYVPPPR